MLRECDIFNFEKFRCQILDSCPKSIKRYLSEAYRQSSPASSFFSRAKHCFAGNEALLCSWRKAFCEKEKMIFSVKIHALPYGCMRLSMCGSEFPGIAYEIFCWNMVLANEKPQNVFVKFLRQKCKRILMYGASVYMRTCKTCIVQCTKKRHKICFAPFFQVFCYFLIPTR